VFEVAAEWRGWGAGGVYKKVDSVLRGPVIAELGALLDALGLERCLLVPANPGLGRVISGGQYLVNGVPLHETDFRLDPEYPATTANVLERVRGSGPQPLVALSVRSPGEMLPNRGITIGEAAKAADLAAWSAHGAQSSVLAAGASEFFGAYLGALGHVSLERTPRARPGDRERDLFVCGSSSAGSRAFCKQSRSRGVPVLRMPCGLLAPSVREPGAGVLVEQWVDEVVNALEHWPRAVLAIDRPLCSDPGMPQVLGGYLSEAVGHVLGQIHVDRLFVEGGATAVALVRRMGWTRMRVRYEWATGVVRLEVVGQAAPLMSMKPGSYAWPDVILA
jgi:uncharacterized protein YgbK (DUF1537 family)